MESQIAPARSSNKRDKFLWSFVGALTFIFTLSCFIPWQPYFVRTSDLDESWMLALNAVFRNGMQFGRDIVFTYGPWGFVNTRCYHPNTWPWMVGAWTLVAIAVWRTCWVICRRHHMKPAMALIWLTAVPGFAIMGTEHQSSTLLCVIGLLPVFYFFCDESPFSFTSILLAFAAALAGAVKFTYLFAALLVILPITVDQIRRKQTPGILFMFSASFMGMYLLAGQKLASLWPYLRLSWQVADFYTDAMSFTPGIITPQNPAVPVPIDLILFVAAALALIAIVFAAAWRQRKWESLLPISALSGLLFVTFKWGFVRHEGQHTALADLILVAVTLAHWPFLRSALPERKWVVRRGAVLTASILVCWQSVQSATGLGLPAYFVGSLFVPIPANMSAAIRMCSGRSTLPREYADSLRDIRESSPLPSLQGTSDIYPWNQASLIAYGAKYDPRPIFQSYSAYSPELARINADHLTGSKAPDSVLFSARTGGTCLRHFPPTDDSLSWPALLTQYDLESSTGDFLFMKKSPNPRPYSLTPISRFTTTFGETIKVPTINAGPVWVEISVKPTRAGKLLSFLYKNPELYLKICTAGGKPRTYRVVAGQTEVGFLLSPAIDDNESFASFVKQEPMENRQVTSIMLSDRAWVGEKWAYRPELSIAFSRLRLGRPQEIFVDSAEDSEP